MANVYLMIYEPAGVQRDELIAFMEARDEVADYYTNLPANLFTVVSPLSAEDVTAVFKGVSGLSHYLFVRIETHRYRTEIFGWMPQTMWDFILRHSQKPAPTTPVEPEPPKEQAPIPQGAV